MPKLSASVRTLGTDKDGKDITPSTERSTGGNKSFWLVKPDYYTAVVKGLKFSGDKRWAVKGTKSKAKDGKWTHWVITPDVVLLNDNKTQINRQDVIIGAVEDGELVRPDGDTTQSPIWSVALYMLTSLGLIHKAEDGSYPLDFDPDLIANRVVKVRVGVGGYIKNETGFDVKQMHNLLLEQNNGQEYEFEDIPALVDQFNEDNERDGETKLKTKNVITNFYMADASTIEENGYFVAPDGVQTFVSEKDYEKYLQLLDASDSYQEPDF